MRRAFGYLSLMIVAITVALAGCRPKPAKEAAPPTPVADQGAEAWLKLLPSVVSVSTYDGERILENGQGFFVDSQLVLTRLSLVGEANRAVISPLGSNELFDIEGFVALDRISDLVLLKTKNHKSLPLPLFESTAPNGAKTFILTPPAGKNLELRTGQVISYTPVNGLPLYQISNQIFRNAFGVPVFVSTRQVIGIAFSEVVDYKQRSLVVPSQLIATLMEKAAEEPRPLTMTRSMTDKAKSESNSRIRGILLSTGMGDITIRLFNETPEYRDNFIRLAEEGYYDNLLIHRVIAGFGIQSGAADTRYAGKDDVVGWKGPGYTLPAHIVPGKFHQRGMIGSPRKPDRDNSRRRSDGSQFYIVSGRTYNDLELNDIEKENNHRFTPQQREVYRTVGGAPHIDGSYTIFGEVVSGMEVVDQISQVETGKEFRPVKDIRLKKVTILR